MDVARCVQEAKLLREANVAVRARSHQGDSGLSGTGMARAASAGSMRRPKGRAAAALASQSGSPVSAACNSRSWSEAIQPTLSWLTRMRFFMTEKAVFRVSVASAPFVAQYALMKG